MKRCITLIWLLCSASLAFSQETQSYNEPLTDTKISEAEIGTEFYLLGECTEVMIENRQLKRSILKSNGEKYRLVAYHKLPIYKEPVSIYNINTGQEVGIKGAYYPADSLLLSRIDSVERAYIISELQCKGRYEEEPVGLIARLAAGLSPKSKKAVQKTADFFEHYFENVSDGHNRKEHPFGSEFIEIEDSQKQIHYIPVYKRYKATDSYTLDKVLFGPFIESNYYDWLQDTFVGKEICLMGGNYSVPCSAFDFFGVEKINGRAGDHNGTKNAYKCVGFKPQQDSEDIVVQIENYSYSTPYLKRYESQSPTDIGGLTTISKSEKLMEIAVANCMSTSIGYFITSEAFDNINKGLDVLRAEYQAKEAEKLAKEAEEQRLKEVELAEIKAREAKEEAEKERLKEAELAEIKAREAKEKAERRKSLIGKYGEHYGTLISEGKIEIGMTLGMCKEALFITRIKSEQTESQTAEIWKEYFGKKYLVFVNGKLVKITEY